MQSLVKLVHIVVKKLAAIKKLRQRLFYGSAIAVLFFLGWVAVLHGVANLSGVYAERKLNKWAVQSAINQKELVLVENSIKRALNLQPDNAHYHLLQAKLFEWKAFSDKEHANTYLKKATSSLDASINYRPNWPNVWLEIALIEHKLSRYDDRFQQAIITAEHLGGYKQDVTLGLIRLGFETWYVRSAFMKGKLIEAIKRGLATEHTAWKVLELAKENGHVRIVCIVHRRLEGASALPAQVAECS
ncbi:VpsP family polysaccharide biosynthesis protein [Corallincola spongiicola]|uniref:Tetratricopeptide repeat protein n=1 Tax=Corallincola spongiicola TaxID=2520508 RepID=A0ABY1WSQ2_9GAMM|nr:VpsP family polysaccharide biosynthesis protein [Corallincola spongiicola]TAA47765.1 hypothetical protein EXY25_00500 [Corallincola spongiicola]